MLISVCQRPFNGAHAFQGTAIQIANFIQMKGAGVCRFCFLCALRADIQRLGGAKMDGSEWDKPTAAVVSFIGCGVLPRPAAISLK